MPASTEAFYAAAGLPAIYILELRTDWNCIRQSAPAVKAPHDLPMRSQESRVSRSTAEDGDICEIDIRRARVIVASRLTTSSGRRSLGFELDLDGYLLLPGLINAHDHLGVRPVSQPRRWAIPKFAQMGRVHSKARTSNDRGASIRSPRRSSMVGSNSQSACAVSRLCAITIRCIRSCWPKTFPCAWSATTAGHTRSPWTAQVEAKFEATPEDAPFVLHACEGVDESCAAEIFRA